MSNFLDYVSLGKIVTIREQLMKAASKGQKVYRFESGDPSFSVHPQVESAINRALMDQKTHYVPVDGIPELRRAVADRMTRQGVKVDPSDVFITNGAMQALYVVYQALHDTDTDNGIAVPDPMWTEAVENVRLAGMDPQPVRFDPFEENYTWDVIESQTSSLKGVFINSPHNPTGRVLNIDQKKQIIDNCVDNDLWIISDEAYEGVTFGEQHTPMAAIIPESYDKWVSIHSMSKTFAMSGLRVGWLVTKNPVLKSRLSKILRCTTNGINSATQWGAITALGIPTDDQYFQQMVDEYKVRRQIAYDALSNNSLLKPLWPDGGFFIWCRVNGYDADTISEKLASMGIGNAPGSCFGDSIQTSQSIRFSFSVDTAQLRQGMDVLSGYLGDESFKWD